MRRSFIALLSVGVLAAPMPAAALEVSASRSTVHRDPNDDVRVVPMGYPEETRIGEGHGDIRRVVTRVGRNRVRVAVTFDAYRAAERLTLRLNFAARGVSGGRGYIAQLAGNRATGVPEQSFYGFYPGEFEETELCSGLTSDTAAGRWIFTVPTSCLGQSRRVRYQEISLQTEFMYDDAYGYDKWPRRGAAKVR